MESRLPRAPRPAPRHPHKKRNYTEKTQAPWQCRVCRENYDPAIPYCLSCYQALYYYCYVNAELFVQKDLAYLDLYYHTPHPEPDEQDDSEEEKDETEIAPDLQWIDTLLA